ncbi:hypothetical protein JCM19314_2303 [Nonlabens ulvanivorans]|uniref:Uncharacterized protein n=1 Tax=Nonlabens ulvanivorans TaxID=906888 RepID=A0A090QFT7_NONUL|nr:hypothetical protein JCM19314_2303 [Nonlabens ulvanivorans]
MFFHGDLVVYSAFAKAKLYYYSLINCLTIFEPCTSIMVRK